MHFDLERAKMSGADNVVQSGLPYAMFFLHKVNVQTTLKGSVLAQRAKMRSGLQNVFAE